VPANELLTYESSKPRWKKKTDRARASDRASQTADDEWLHCARCGAQIAEGDARCQRAGLHEHSQVNAHGYIWVFGCFTDAPGARTTGDATTEFTWFAGYLWRVADCKGCGLHLGWRFENDENSDVFWALILERLV